MRRTSFERKTVGEIMIPLDEYPHLPVWSSLLDAIRLMRDSQIESSGRRSLPRVVLLFDLDGSVAGVLRRRDIMRGLEPSFLVSEPLAYKKKLYNVDVDPHLTELSFDRMVKGILAQVERPVSDVMQPLDGFVDYEAHIMQAVADMVSRELSLLAVKRDGRIVGIVRTVDVFQQLTEIVVKCS